jgi:glutamyl-tRNA(Gln) amidotransferase subunit E
MDYKKIGLKVGIEIHQRISSDHKLFCSCKAQISQEKHKSVFKRKLRAVAGELGKIDPAAMYELYRDRNFFYQTFEKESCLVELDSEPPGMSLLTTENLPIEPDALDAALTIAKSLKMYTPEEIHVMRKTVIDGSNTSGFQRTMIIGIGKKDSVIETSYGDVRIKDLFLLLSLFYQYL